MIFKDLLILFSLIFYFSCKQNKNATHQTSHQNLAQDSMSVINESINNLSIQTHSFFEIDTTGILILPLSMAEVKGEDRSHSYKKIPDNNYWNMIFYNSKTGVYHLLDERKMVIENYDYDRIYNKGDGVQIHDSDFIFYTIKTDDFNNDKLLNVQDPLYLFVSDKYGHGFKQISPVGYHLNTWQFIKGSNKIMMTVQKDTDHNKIFDESDETIVFEFDLGQEGAKANAVFNNDFNRKMKILFDKYWKKQN